jgi:hypothetical protein
MKSFTTRVVAWSALALLATATLTPCIAPALDASLADVAALCTPAAVAAAGEPGARPARIPLRMPRCGVA